MPRDPADKYLKAALVEAYASRANLFHQGVKGSRMREMFATIDAFDPSILKWDSHHLHITENAIAVLRAKHIPLHAVFAHPTILQQNPRTIAYYRNLVAVSQKGMSQMGLPTAKFERNAPASMSIDAATSLCRTLNSILSRLVEAEPDFELTRGRDVAFAEIGTELQGSWANRVGRGAAKAVEGILADYVRIHQRGEYDGHGRFVLNNGWKVFFGTEPDIKFLDADEVERITVEIKGSLDRAGAQTRYGEAKKSFAKARAKNPRCYTVYLASCFTEAVEQQIKADGQVSDRFNLTSILRDQKEQTRFLSRLFHVVDMPT
jgi:hypothetical protein